jgi:phosphatidylserine/phosphatidylglycerophosphate/cardiolipin synthase-like enzyme
MVRKRSGSSGHSWVIFILLIILLGMAYYIQQMKRAAGYRIEHAPAGKVVSEEHLAPAENLEQIDLDRLGEARRTIDMAMYAFTDQHLANELVKLARKGVEVRIYRDGEQFEDEQKNAEARHDSSAMDVVHGEARIHVRVKPASRRDLMHLKAYVVDGKILREGSANFSEAGEKLQDNNAHFTNDPSEIEAFEREFNVMWSRPENDQVQ